MAHATKITIATGTTAYAGDPENDECISSREVRVEVTYQLEPGEDPTLAVLLNTPEVERTRRIAWQCIHDAPEPSFDSAAPGLEPPDATDTAQEDDPRMEEIVPPPVVTVPLSTAAPATNGASAAPPQPEPEELATKPQQIAIRSHFTRLGLSKSDQRALLSESFGKFREDWLTKGEAALMMRALERGDWQKPPLRQTAVPSAPVH